MFPRRKRLSRATDVLICSAILKFEFSVGGGAMVSGGIVEDGCESLGIVGGVRPENGPVCVDPGWPSCAAVLGKEATRTTAIVSESSRLDGIMSF